MASNQSFYGNYCNAKLTMAKMHLLKCIFLQILTVSPLTALVHFDNPLP